MQGERPSAVLSHLRAHLCVRHQWQLRIAPARVRGDLTMPPFCGPLFRPPTQPAKELSELSLLLDQAPSRARLSRPGAPKNTQRCQPSRTIYPRSHMQRLLSRPPSTHVPFVLLPATFSGHDCPLTGTCASSSRGRPCNRSRRCKRSGKTSRRAYIQQEFRGDPKGRRAIGQMITHATYKRIRVETHQSSRTRRN